MQLILIPYLPDDEPLSKVRNDRRKMLGIIWKLTLTPHPHPAEESDKKSPGRLEDVLSKIDFSQQRKGIFEKTLRNFVATYLTNLIMQKYWL